MRLWGRYGGIGLAAVAGAVLVIGVAATLAHDDESEPRVKSKVVVIRQDGEGGGAYLGVEIEEETENPEGGARIGSVVEDSPAEKAGLREGDIVVRFGDRRIYGPRALTERIHASNPGDSVEIEVIREGKRQTLTAELGERPKAFGLTWHDGKGPFAFEWDEEAFQDRMKELGERLKELKIPEIPVRPFSLFGSFRPKLGVQLVETTPELRVHLGGKEDAGVLVGSLMKGMPAEKAGIKVGDLIVAVDGEEVESAGDLVEALEDKEGQTVEVEVVRDRKLRTIEVPIPAPAEEEQGDISGPRALRPAPEPLRESRRQVAAALWQAREAAAEARRERARILAEAARARREVREAIREQRARARERWWGYV